MGHSYFLDCTLGTCSDLQYRHSSSEECGICCAYCRDRSGSIMQYSYLLLSWIKLTACIMVGICYVIINLHAHYTHNQIP